MIYGRQTTGNIFPAFSGEIFRPASSIALAMTGSRPAKRSSGVGTKNSSGVTPTPSRLFPSDITISAVVMEIPPQPVPGKGRSRIKLRPQKQPQESEI